MAGKHLTDKTAFGPAAIEHRASNLCQQLKGSEPGFSVKRTVLSSEAEE
jgi:hypothetical protein